MQPVPSSVQTIQTTPEEQSARTDHEFGAPPFSCANLPQVADPVSFRPRAAADTDVSLLLNLCAGRIRTSSAAAVKASTRRVRGGALNQDTGLEVSVWRAGSPDGGNSRQQGESRARPSPLRLMASPAARGSPPRLQAMARVAQQPLRCSQRAQPAPGASFLPKFTTFQSRPQCAPAVQESGQAL